MRLPSTSAVGSSLVVLLSLAAPPAAAVPSFARQVNMPCSACHTVYPQLTSFGRLFKANGYALSATEEVIEKSGKRNELELARYAPLSAQLVGSYTRVRKPAPGVLSGDVLLPDQLGLFYAGQIAPDFGAFLQLTYASDADHVTMDNADLRYARQLTVKGRSLVVGATLNNNPTVQDLWNTTPAWGWPFATSAVWPGTGSNAALIDGSLAQAVAGATVYGFLEETVYAELGLYRSALVGAPRPFDQTTAGLIDNVAPYWRVAVQREFGRHRVEVGTYGLHAGVKPGGTTPPPGGYAAKDSYTDVAFDAEWQYQGAAAASVRGTWIHEKRTLDASVPGEAPTLDTVRVSGDVFWEAVGLGAGLFHTGSSYSDAFGATRAAGTTGQLLEVTARPWENATFRAQYTHYVKVDGVSAGASDADAFTLLAWIAF